MIRNIFYGFSIVAFLFSFAFFSNNASAAYGEEFLFEESLAVDNENLDQIRGTALSPEVLGIAAFDAISANNTSNGTISGGNVIDAGAFSNSSGLSTIIQNSGNNVLIQSATILNLNIE